jgi:hypothetical protein
LIDQDEMEQLMAMDKETLDRLVAFSGLKQMNANLEHMRKQQSHWRNTTLLAVVGILSAIFGYLIGKG